MGQALTVEVGPQEGASLSHGSRDRPLWLSCPAKSAASYSSLVVSSQAVNREAVNKEREAVNKEREAVNKEREAVNKEREAVNKEREAVNREREAVRHTGNALAVAWHTHGQTHWTHSDALARLAKHWQTRCTLTSRQRPPR
ncbi:hypothetical protein M3J09_007922 [Ascochyta lentis]